MLRHQYVDLFKDLFEVRDVKWKKEEKNMNASALFLFLPLYPSTIRVKDYVFQTHCFEIQGKNKANFLWTKTSFVFTQFYLPRKLNITRNN